MVPTVGRIAMATATTGATMIATTVTMTTMGTGVVDPIRAAARPPRFSLFV